LYGAYVLLEQLLEREIIYLPCRHHIYEIILKVCLIINLGQHRAQTCQFLKGSNKPEEQLTLIILILAYKIVLLIDSVNYVCDHIIKFSKDRLLEKHPRDDYRE